MDIAEIKTEIERQKARIVDLEDQLREAERHEASKKKVGQIFNKGRMIENEILAEISKNISIYQLIYQCRDHINVTQGSVIVSPELMQSSVADALSLFFDDVQGPDLITLGREGRHFDDSK